MAAPTLQGSSAIAAATGTTTITPTLPTHQADDILIVCAGIRQTIGVLDVATAGWALLTSEAGGASSNVYWFWKRATGGAETNPAVSVTTGTGDHYAQAHVIRGCITTGDPWDVFEGSFHQANDPSTFVGVTTTVADTLIFFGGVEMDNVVTSTVVTATDPASIGTASSTSNRYVVSATGSDGGCWGIAAAKASIGATGDISSNWSGTPDGGAGLVIAFKPPGGSTVTFAASVAGAGSVAAQSDRTRAVAASIAGAGQLTAAVAETRALDAAVAGLATATVQADRQRALAAAVAGTGTLTADVTVEHVVALAAAIVGLAEVTAANAETRALAATVTGQATAAADLAAQRTLAAVVNGQAALTAATVRQIGLAALAAGTAQVVTGLAAQRALALVATGQAGISGAVTVEGSEVLVIVDTTDLQTYIAVF